MTNANQGKPANDREEIKNDGEGDDEESVKPKQIDFEKMIEEALKAAGGEMPTSSPKKVNKPVVNDKADQPEKESKPIPESVRKQKEKAKALLEKRKKYDPRKVLKKPKPAKVVDEKPDEEEKAATETDDRTYAAPSRITDKSW